MRGRESAPRALRDRSSGHGTPRVNAVRPGPREFAELGVEEYFAGDGVCVVEWADKVADVLPADHLRVEITPTEPTARRFTLTATGPRHERLLADLSPQPGGPPAE